MARLPANSPSRRSSAASWTSCSDLSRTHTTQRSTSTMTKRPPNASSGWAFSIPLERVFQNWSTAPRARSATISSSRVLAIYEWLDLTPLPAKADHVRVLEERTAAKDRNHLHLINVISAIEAARARGKLADSRTECHLAIERIDHEAITVPSLHLNVLSQAALADLYRVDSRILGDFVRRRDARIFRGVPLYMAGVYFASIDVAAHHLLGAPLELDQITEALASAMTHTCSIAIRTIVAELVDRGVTEPVRTTLERFRAIPYPDEPSAPA